MATIDRIRTLFKVVPDTEFSGREIHQIVGGWLSGAVYIALSRMENAGEISARFEEGQYPRRRYYRARSK